MSLESLATWAGFAISTILLILVARKTLWGALASAAFVLGVFTVAPRTIGLLFLAVGTTLDNFFLALSFAIIPVVGKLLNEAGYMTSLVSSIKISRASFNMISPALVGLLPVPGGALISAPMIDETASDLPAQYRCASNVWFRHVLFIVYPVSSTIILSTQVAQVNRYLAIACLIPFLVIAIILGYVFFLKKVEGKLESTETYPRNMVIRPLIILAITPAIDLLLRELAFPLAGIEFENLSLMIGTTCSLILAIAWSEMKLSKFLKVTRAAHPWNFFLFILMMFFYLEVFNASGIDGLISSYNLHPTILLCMLGFAFGFITGRMNVPLLIIIPIFLNDSALPSMTLLPFAVVYMSVYVGYVISPVHPCLSVTLEFFKVSYIKTAKVMIPPGAILLALTFILSFFIR
ncbi:DUF401 family protein [Candidatus Bathyarchaeota archaeon]|nr:DUF401 family protein [Candidatus Bathyarchaeota archaeon]